jgi:hypothetical protein
MSWPVAASMIRMSRSWTNDDTGSGVGSADADGVELAAVPQDDLAGLVDAVAAGCARMIHKGRNFPDAIVERCHYSR